jgi:hypothetical protein
MAPAPLCVSPPERECALELTVATCADKTNFMRFCAARWD